MTGMVEKIYGDALFELICDEDEDALGPVNEELREVDLILEQVPELIKLAGTPTVGMDEKLSVISEAFKDKVSEYTFNFLMVLTEGGRLAYFGKIRRYFLARSNDRFGIAEITVVSTEPVNEALKADIKRKMSEVTGKKIVLKEELDPSLIGGIVLRYGSRSFDGSVRSRLDALKKEIGGIIS